MFFGCRDRQEAGAGRSRTCELGAQLGPHLRAGRSRVRIPSVRSEIGACFWFVACLTLCFGGQLASAAEAQRVLRVAADPNNLPFSNDRGEGFENRIAELVAEELGARLDYMWWPQRRGFFRETIGSGRADLVIGAPAGFERVATTRPYYRSTYVFVSRRDATPVSSLDDPALEKLTIGVQLIGDDFNNSPPAHALSARGMIQNVRGYTVYGDYGKDSPPSEIVKAVARGEIDLAVAWGPMAGYFAIRQSVPLEVLAVTPERDGPTRPFTFSIAMGVRRGNSALRDEVDGVIERRSADIERILREYNVPLLPLERERTGEVDDVAAR